MKCTWEGGIDCSEEATRRVRTITSEGDVIADLCDRHATLALAIEREWDDAEREMLDQ